MAKISWARVSFWAVSSSLIPQAKSHLHTPRSHLMIIPTLEVLLLRQWKLQKAQSRFLRAVDNLGNPALYKQLGVAHGASVPDLSFQGPAKFSSSEGLGTPKALAPCERHLCIS
mmetsp:Transcript_123023/g.213444  ORF Transcript_123023/g.213444 Transcript_123023/m.213444 type:complete len:114 (+) Transcript_123023:524-865(+)